MPKPESRKLLDRKALRAHKGIPWSDTHLDRMIESGKFPAPFHISERRPVWFEDVIDNWLEEQAAKAA